MDPDRYCIHHHRTTTVRCKLQYSDLKTETNSNEAAVNALDLINVVPNPYYAYSAYEKNQIENRVKFTNLPEKCTIRIYTVSGT